MLRLLLTPEEREGGVRHHQPGPAGAGRAGPGGATGQGPGPLGRRQVLKPLSRSRCPSIGDRCPRRYLKRRRLPGRGEAQTPCGWPLCPSSCRCGPEGVAVCATGQGRGQGSQQTHPSPQRLRGSEGLGRGAGLSLAPLNLGDAETGFLTQSNLLNVAGRLGPDWPAVALHLGLSYQELQRIRHEFRWVPLSRLCCPRRPLPRLPGDPRLRLAEVPSRGGGNNVTGREGRVWYFWPGEGEQDPGCGVFLGWAAVTTPPSPGTTWTGRSATCSSPGLSARLGSQGPWGSSCRPWSRVTGGTWPKRCGPSWSSAVASTRMASATQAWLPGTRPHLALRPHSPRSLPRPRPADSRLAPDVPPPSSLPCVREQ